MNEVVRKAEELKSLDELNLSTRTRYYIKKRGLSMDNIVWQARFDAFIHEDDHIPKWRQEVMSALQEAGFIRPPEDFETITFLINRLYSAILGRHDFVTHFGDLSNSKYESFRALSEEEVESVKTALSRNLTEKEFQILYYRFGLDGEKPKACEAVGHHFNITREHIKQIEAKALRKLRCSIDNLPKVVDAPDTINEAAEKLNNELEEINMTPEVIREHEIITELERMRKYPFRYTCSYLSSKATDQADIDNLELSVRAYNCLRRAGINTISDILNLPKDDWFKVKNLGRKRLEEVIEKMHSFGYANFNVEIPSTLYRWPA